MKDILCLVTGQTYELVLDTNVTAHPAIQPYPSAKPEYAAHVNKVSKIAV